MSIVTTTFSTLTWALKHEKSFDHVISLIDPSESPKDLPKFSRSTRRTTFSRVDTDHAEHENAPTEHNAYAIFNTLKSLKDQNILVHCTAGIGRSSAVAVTNLMLNDYGVGRKAKACTALVHHRHQPTHELCPNLLLVQHFDTVLGCNGKLVTEMHKVSNTTLRQKRRHAS